MTKMELFKLDNDKMELLEKELFELEMVKRHGQKLDFRRRIILCLNDKITKAKINS